MEIPFELEGHSVQQFKEHDPFNDNEIEGYLFRRADMRYGMLYITHVNGKPAEQIIWATPKLHYPFDKNGDYKFPDNIDSIRVFEKIDGSNVMGYQYHDHEGNPFVTYKTRLRPVIKDGNFGRFEVMWREILDMYPEIPEEIFKSPYNFSFEMYGKRNKILVDYDVSLDAKLLFARDRKTGNLFTPEMASKVLPKAPVITNIDHNSNLEEEYKRVVEYLNGKIKVTERENEQDLVQGMEGSIWYLLSGNKDEEFIQYKCKPDYVRDIHFEASGTIPKHSIYITCINAFEEKDDPDINYIKQLLLEEFSEEKILKKWYTIEQILEQVRFKMKLKYDIIEEYQKHPEFNMLNDKTTVMRHFGQLYEKRLSGHIYQLLWDEFGGE